MTTTEFLAEQLADTHLQVTKVYEGLPNADWDKKSSEAAMTPRQILGHLNECCLAFLSEDPHTYAWGTYEMGDKPNEDLMAEYNDLRSKCVDKAANASDDSVIKGASSFIALHEAYHVGQLATLRLSLDPEWNAYSIYGM